MTNSSVLRQYEIIAAISGQMLAQARIAQWDKVVVLGEQYQNAVKCLRTIAPLSDEDKMARQGLLKRILEDDASIRLLAAPELSRLGALLGDVKRHQTVLRTYYQTTANA